MKGKSVFSIGSIVLILIVGVVNAKADEQEHEFVNLVKDLLQGEELKTFQNAYSALPVEFRDKLTKDLLSNPGKLGKDLMNMFGPQVQNLMQNFGGGLNLQNLANIAQAFNVIPNQQKPPQRKLELEDNEVSVEVEDMQMNYNKNEKRRPQKSSGGGFDFGPLGSMLGNLVSSNPQMLVNMIQTVTQAAGGKQGFSFESLMNTLTQQVDIDTVINMAAAFGAIPSPGGGSAVNKRGEGEGKVAKSAFGGFGDFMQIQEMMKWWTDFIKSPTGQKVNRVLPRLLKSETLPDALRIIEKEMSFRFDMILRQIQDPAIRQFMVAQAVRPVGEFFRGIKVPSDLKEVINKADDVLNNKMGFGEKTKEYIEPVTQYIRETFKITKESLLDLRPEDIEKIASDILNNEVLEPMTSVWDAYGKAIEHSTCASFVFCQLNNNFFSQNFIRRYVIKTSSIISAFQASATMKKDAFSKLYESIHHGADGFDCTHGISGFCLDLMHTAAHNEL
ncbi:hypothetical protein Ocin01_17957 [Orchesella cincta]|uniref:Protein G12 n=1 Tax=Orchesella cincta TaxID=48709 RepID=A0A1D2M724_ORCCI|nr:hypothetical protein Ocin01_17957 [Orchesella cincta]